MRFLSLSNGVLHLGLLNKWAARELYGFRSVSDGLSFASLKTFCWARMKVYTRVPRVIQKMKGGKIIGVVWMDVKNGDSQNPAVRSRLAGQEFNIGSNDELYASTPLLEALRYV